MLVETRDGTFVLEDAHTFWPDHPDILEHGAWPPHEKIFTSREAALIRAAHIITERFGTDINEWLEAAGIAK